jgi:hypothetical protein
MKLFMFLLSLYSLIGTCNSAELPYCRCREAMKLFMFLLSPYSLIGTCYSV